MNGMGMEWLVIHHNNHQLMADKQIVIGNTMKSNNR